ncbi:hypothetical protein OAM67_00100 [bacterium]|nr:hypothetical protein [bacterium]
MSNNGAIIQIVARTALDKVLTAVASITFFRSKSAQYSVFASDFQEVLFNRTSLQSAAQQTLQADVPRSGDLLAHVFLSITAPAIVNVTAAASDRAGSTVNQNSTEIKRAVIGGGHVGSGRERVVLSTTTTADAGSNGNFVLSAASTKVKAGMMYKMYPSAASGTVTATGVTGTLKLTGVNPDAAVEQIFTLTDDGDTSLAGITAAITGHKIIEGRVGIVASDNITITPDAHDATSKAASVYTVAFYDDGYSGAVGAGDENPITHEQDPNNEWLAYRADGPNPASENKGMAALHSGGSARSVAAFYCKWAPCQLVETVQLLIGSSTIDTITGHMLQIYQELYCEDDKSMRKALNRGHSEDELKQWALQKQQWYVPLPFFFATSYAKALPLVALSFHNVTFKVVLHSYTSIVVNGCAGDHTGLTITSQNGLNGSTATTLETKAAKTEDSVSALCSGSSDATVASLSNMAAADFGVKMLVEYIYLGPQERQQYAALQDQMVITQHQTVLNSQISGSSMESVKLQFNHPVACMYWVGQLQTHANMNHRGRFSGPSDPFTCTEADPQGKTQPWLKTAQCKFNNNTRTAAFGPEFFLQLQPSLHGARIPDEEIYMLSFGLSSPYNHQQSGSANFSRLDSATLELMPQAHLFTDQSKIGGINGATTTAAVGSNAVTGGQKVNVHVFATSINVLSFENGMGGLQYA